MWIVVVILCLILIRIISKLYSRTKVINCILSFYVEYLGENKVDVPSFSDYYDYAEQNLLKSKGFGIDKFYGLNVYKFKK